VQVDQETHLLQLPLKDKMVVAVLVQVLMVQLVVAVQVLQVLTKTHLQVEQVEQE
jgi:energy-converting hydrogenase Eha subunit H